MIAQRASPHGTSLALHRDMTEVAIIETREEMEKIWRQIEAVARPPYAQSWGWIENWLAFLDHAPALAVIHDDAGAPIAAAFEDQPVLRAPAFPALGCTGPDYRIVLDRELVVPHVDLEAVRCVEG
ncbi:MAG TPA: hypothetical protein VFO79_03630, partial [Xanthomonadales bacterium]|nr:hypothetical protein [Xanthomonadales bacterium]